jgi:GST-like protein
MAEAYRVYGGPGSGSVAVEAAMTLLGAPYVTLDAASWCGPDAKALAGQVNPLGQVPTVELPDGRLMTESAAILLWLGDTHPESGLAPAPDAPERSDYLRWMVYVPANIYAMYLLKDDPSIWLDGAQAQDQLRERAIERIKSCWRVMEAWRQSQSAPPTWLLGERMSLLDVYICLVSRWTPRRRWFAQACPGLNAIVERIDALPELSEFWAKRFPFSEGWQG